MNQVHSFCVKMIFIYRMVLRMQSSLNLTQNLDFSEWSISDENSFNLLPKVSVTLKIKCL